MQIRTQYGRSYGKVRYQQKLKFSAENACMVFFLIWVLWRTDTSRWIVLVRFALNPVKILDTPWCELVRWVLILGWKSGQCCYSPPCMQRVCKKFLYKQLSVHAALLFHYGWSGVLVLQCTCTSVYLYFSVPRSILWCTFTSMYFGEHIPVLLSAANGMKK
jgi:hypothetical protein